MTSCPGLLGTLSVSDTVKCLWLCCMPGVKAQKIYSIQGVRDYLFFFYSEGESEGECDGALVGCFDVFRGGALLHARCLLSVHLWLGNC